jgi:hypothetical protein
MWVIGFALSLSYLIIDSILGQSMLKWAGYVRGTGNALFRDREEKEPLWRLDVDNRIILPSITICDNELGYEDENWICSSQNKTSVNMV